MPANISTRLICLVYETLIVLGLGVLSGLPFVYLTDYPHHPELRSWYRGYLFIIYAIYFAYQWHHTGQTVAMKTWRLKIIDRQTHTPPTYLQALRRYVLATCLLFSGISLIWLVIDRQHRWLHDILSGTETVRIQPTNVAPAND
ncbi:RDD family protein [Ferrovum sp. PN-J185]|uniref:RDD family protein n=1 Tax=Ferrovum sp. PN-J185 TaxID=1356306 RepID=UPI0007925E8D|nr:RDD family protein [Ferrovum sp. PN-J185]KXW55283.1 RDD family protein [Ferrovum sp. PN-J185]MCC6068652.1 RDD family protein [Ferrovum sp. PN-J185]